MHRLGPRVDSIYPCVSKGRQHNGALEWAIIINLAAAGIPVEREPVSHGLDMHIYHVGGHFRQTHRDKHTKRTMQKSVQVEQQVRRACGKTYLA